MSCLQQLARGGSLPYPAGMMLVEQLTTFCLLFSLYLSTLHDAEFYHEMKGMPCCGQTCKPDMWLADMCLSSAGSFMPFSLSQLAAMIQVLRDVFVSLHLQRPLRLPSTQPTSLDWNCLKQVSGGCSLVPRLHGRVKAWLQGYGGGLRPGYEAMGDAVALLNCFYSTFIDYCVPCTSATAVDRSAPLATGRLYTCSRFLPNCSWRAVRVGGALQ